jgi:hypothetical protein
MVKPPPHGEKNPLHMVNPHPHPPPPVLGEDTTFEGGVCVCVCVCYPEFFCTVISEFGGAAPAIKK